MSAVGASTASIVPTERISVIGAGRLGLCWALAVEQAGYAVKAVDVFPTYVDAINKRTLKSSEPHVVNMLKKCKNLTACLSIEETAAFSKYIYIFVQTPSTGGDRHYDHTHLNDVLSQLNALKVCDKHLVICCTVMPGYCDQIAPSLLSNCSNVTVSYSPEFIAQGAIVMGTLQPDMVLIGEGSREAGDHIEELTLRYVTNGRPSVHRMSPASAEIAKLSLNSFITLKIAFANFLGDLADAAEVARKRAAPSDVERDDKRRKVDKLQIAHALGADSRIGLKCLLPGYGFGGPCFPRDGRALASYASQVAMSSSLEVDPAIAEAPAKANHSHARFQAQQLLAAAEASLARGARRVAVVFDDVTFKPRCSVPIVLESQKLAVAKRIRDLSEHTVIIRSPRADILEAVKRDFGTQFVYWRLAEGQYPADSPVGTAYIIADDELLPTDDGVGKVRVPNNPTRAAAAVRSGGSDSTIDPDAAHLLQVSVTDEAERCGEGPTSMRTVFN